MRPRHFDPTSETITVEVPGPHPVAVFFAGVMDAMMGRQLSGGTGHIPIGDPSSPSVKFSGELGEHQAFHGLYGEGGQRAIPGFNEALPNTNRTAATSRDDHLLDLISGLDGAR